MKRFRELLREAIRHFAEHGYTTAEELADWLDRLAFAAEAELGTAEDDRARLRAEFEAILRRATGERNMARVVPGVGRYTIDMVRPELRAELDRRILASADLIRLNREQAIAKTLQRFSGWSTAIPKGGMTDAQKSDAAQQIGKPVAQVKFEARRVAIDQGHKLSANVADIVARSNGAIAAVWHSHWRRPGYDYREDHKERDEQVYLLRGSWAVADGLVKPGKAGYLDDITQPAQEPYCSCYVTYLTSLRRLPDDMLTAKGRKALEEVSAA